MLSHFSHVQLFVTLSTVAHQAPPSTGFSRHEYWSGLPCPPPGALPDSGIEPMSLISPALADRFFTTIATWEAHEISYIWNFKKFNKLVNIIKRRDFPGSPVAKSP